jgi:hypothetical protein
MGDTLLFFDGDFVRDYWKSVVHLNSIPIDDLPIESFGQIYSQLHAYQLQSCVTGQTGKAGTCDFPVPVAPSMTINGSLGEFGTIALSIRNACRCMELVFAT